MKLFVNIALLFSVLFLTACGGDEVASGPSSEEQMLKWAATKTPENWRVGGFGILENQATLTVLVVTPFDIDYKPKPAWQKQSDGRKFCPSSAETARMGLHDKNLKVVVRGEKVGPLSEVICIRKQ